MRQKKGSEKLERYVNPQNSDIFTLHMRHRSAQVRKKELLCHMRFERLRYTSFVLYNANERVQVPVRVVSIHRVAV
jgi:hypothetical protein